MSEEPITPRSFDIKADSELTEMGIRVWAHSQAVNISVELDLDYDPEYMNAMLQFFPQIVSDQMSRYINTPEESDEKP